MKVLKWFLVVLGLTVIAVLALLTASNVQAQEVLRPQLEHQGAR